MVFNQSRRKTILITVGALLILFATIGISLQVFAHGYVDEAKSRAVLCKEGVNKDCGGVIYEPQSVEGPGNFPEAGVPDGQIASGGGVFPKLDEQSETRWAKVPMSSGAYTFHWTLTAAHATSNWDYYITKEGWDPNSPLERADFELFCTYDEGGKRPNPSTYHDCVIPERDGYHVILAYWEVADTPNAFYQVIDANFDGDFVEPGPGPEPDPGPQPEPEPDPDPGNGANAWNASSVYLGGDVVTYNGSTYKAKWWTQGETPGNAAVWELVADNGGGEPGNGGEPEPDPGNGEPDPGNGDPDVAAWDATAVYLKGDLVSHGGTVYEAQWWTRGEDPSKAGEWGAWRAQ